MKKYFLVIMGSIIFVGLMYLSINLIFDFHLFSNNNQELLEEEAPGVQEHLGENGSDNTVENLAGEEYSPFSGEYIEQDPNIKALMASIENTPAARPQFGLNRATLVYEFLVEGGITRFLALFRQNIPDKIGPIRSVRTYMVKTALDYKALLLHSGASPGGFELLDKLQVDNLDQIYNGEYYLRSEDRKVPHNLFTKSRIKNYIYNLSSVDYQPRFKFQPVRIVNNNIKAREILINYWGDYQVFYEYDEENNCYKRYLNDKKPHITGEGKDAQQIITDNIIVKFSPTREIDDQGRLEIELEGKGDMLFFKNGIIIEGTWEKNEGKWTNFYDKNGEQIILNPGKTWIQVIPRAPELKNVKYGSNLKL